MRPLCAASPGATPVIRTLLLGLELEAWGMVINSCPFEDLVQLSLGEDQRPLSNSSCCWATGPDS